MHGKQMFYLLAETHEGKSLHTQPWKIQKAGNYRENHSQNFQNIQKLCLSSVLFRY